MTSFFWPLVGLFWLVVPRVSTLGPSRYVRDRAKGDALFKRVGVAIAVACVPLWLIQLSAGPGTDVHIPLWPEPQKWLGFGVTALVFLAAVAWLFLGSGARLIAETFGIGEAKARAGASLLLVVLVLANVYAALAMPAG